MIRRFPPLLVVVLLLPGLAWTQPTTSSSSLLDSVREQLRTRVEAERRGLDGLDPQGEAVRAEASVLRFYEERGFEPAWIGPKGPKASVDSLVAALRRTGREGLNPDGYHAEAIVALREEIREDRATSKDRRRDPGRLSDLELLCTDAFLLYGSHLLTGKVSATELTPSWTLSQRRGDLLGALTGATKSGNVRQTLHSFRPPQPEYDALSQALRHYRRIEAAGGWPTLSDGPILKEGMQDSRVETLRERLRSTGDLTDVESEVSPTFDTPLREAVVAFQERHGLEPDGAVGPATRAALNVPAVERVDQLLVNLERWRWMPQDLGRRHVIVNIAGFRLRVVEDGEEALQMRVITGRPYRQTPVFSDAISYLVFNPYWHVPHSIATKDKLPEIKKDPGYLSRQQFEVFRGWGADAKSIDPSTIDWSRLSASTFPYRLRQKPGPLNALGQVKFLFPNRHSVYLHDTPTRGLFAKAERSFSSGCIRVERPLELAEYLLADRAQWSAERIEAALKTSSTERSVRLPETVPVHLQYWTAWAEADGTVHFRTDVYQRDGGVLRALQAAPPVR